jgi:heme-degrading monooxygenase HmoA
MFASIRRYRLESGSIDDLLHLVDTDFAESVQEMDGFLEYQVLECGNGEIITITTFKDRRSAEASMEASADWIRDTLARQFDLRRLEAFVGEIAISRAREEVTVPARY